MTEPVGRWTIPPLGREADDDLPDWLLSAWLSGRLSLNGFGGFDLLDTQRIIGYPGDAIEIDADQNIRFCATDASTHS